MGERSVVEVHGGERVLVEESRVRIPLPDYSSPDIARSRRVGPYRSGSMDISWGSVSQGTSPIPARLACTTNTTSTRRGVTR